MEKRVRFRYVERSVKGGTIAFELPDAASRSAFDKVIKDLYPDLEATSSEIRNGSDTVLLKIKDKRANEIKKMAVEQSVETIRNRVDQFGVTEPEIIPEGNDRIVIQLPGIKESDRKNCPARIQTR